MDFSAIIRRSWELTWKNKWLWVYGLVIGALTVSGGGNNFSSFSNGISSGEKSVATPQASADFQNIINMVTQGLVQVPPWVWVILVFGALALIIFGLVVRWVALGWAKGALIGGLRDADGGEKATLNSTTKHGLKSVKNLIIYGILAAVIALGTIIALLLIIGVVGLVFSSSRPLMIFWFVAAGSVGLLSTTVIIIILAMVNVYAERLIVFEEFSPWQAWKKGLSLSKGNFLNTALMGVVNSLMGCAIGCGTTAAIMAVLAIPGVALAWPFFSGHYPIASIIGLLLLVLLGVYATFIIRAFMVVFTFSNWNLFFKQVRGGRYEG